MIFGPVEIRRDPAVPVRSGWSAEEGEARGAGY